MNHQTNHSSPKPGDPPVSKIIEPLQHKRARAKSRLPLFVSVLAVTGETRSLDVAHSHYHKNSPLSFREEFPLLTLREIYEASVEIRPDLWLPVESTCQQYHCSEATIYPWIRTGELKSVILCGKGCSRRLRRIYRPSLDILVAKLASIAPHSKWAVVAAAVPSIVELRRASRRRARQAAAQVQFEKLWKDRPPQEFSKMALTCLETAS